MTSSHPPDHIESPGPSPNSRPPSDPDRDADRSALPEYETVAELLRMPVDDLDALVAERRKGTETVVDIAERHLAGHEITRILTSIFEVAGEDALDDVRAAFQWRRLERGEVLFEEGAEADSVCVVASGRLEARVRSIDGTARAVGEILPGETVGEMAVTTGRPRAATVVALRSSALYECERETFLALLRRHPVLNEHVFRVLAQRLDRANRNDTPVASRLSIAVVPLHDSVAAGAFVDPFLGALGSAGTVLRLDQDEVERRVGRAVYGAGERLAELRLMPWFEDQESMHDFVVYEADPDLSRWTRRCLSRADRIVMLADADASPDLSAVEAEMDRVLAGARPPVHLVLVHPEDREQLVGTARWLEPRTVRAHHHVRRGRPEDVERVFRLMTGRGLGLVLSGGGARGFAHIGVIGAFEKLGIPIDAVGGTSAGAAVGGHYAMGLTPDEVREACRHSMVDRRPFKDYTLPVYSFVKRDSLDDVLRSAGGDRDLADTWIPFFCTSADLHSGDKVVHTRGLFWKAIRASISLPGIVPPVIDGDRLLVDGGVLDNLPQAEMVDFCGGRVIAVDVSGGTPAALDVAYEDLPSPWTVLWNRVLPWRKAVRVPTLLDVLLRTATVSNTGQLRTADGVELLIEPPVSEFGLLAFEEIDRIVDTSYDYAIEVLSGWTNGSPAS